MAELTCRSVCKMTHTDWLPSRAITFSYQQWKNFLVHLKKNKPDSGTFYKKISKNKLQKKKLNVLNDNFKQKTRWIDTKSHEEIGKNKQVNSSHQLTNIKFH